MKNQYFGDNKDLFTYDLILQIMRSGLVEHFTFIPMLTSNDGTGHGARCRRDKAKAGIKNRELVAFLDECVNGGRRDISQLEGFFGKHGIEMKIYDRGFSHQERQDYFGQIGGRLLSDSLIFVDPDIGLEVKKSGEGHILYSEVKDLYQRMDDSSILMVYQYIPRQPRQEYLNNRCEELKEKVAGDYPICIDDNEIAFFFLTKDKSLEHSLLHVIEDYAECYSEQGL